MNINTGNGTQIPEPIEDNYEGDKYWEDLFGFDHPNATRDQASLETVREASSSTSALSDSRNTLSALQFWSNSSCPAGYPIGQSPAEFRATSDHRVAPRPNAPSNNFVTPTYLTPLPNDPFGAIDIEPAWHNPWPGTSKRPERCCGIRCDEEQQPQTSSPTVETGTDDAQDTATLLGLAEPLLHGRTSDALAVNCAGCSTSETGVPYSSYFENHQLPQKQMAIHMNDYVETGVELPPDISTSFRHGHRAEVHATNSPTSLSTSSPRDSLHTSKPMTSATSTNPTEESWKCENCGTVLKTKDTKYRNRNKKRHHCPGTGPKYPCPTCTKSFNRDDTLLVHLRKRHPEMSTKPPRPRKRPELH